MRVRDAAGRVDGNEAQIELTKSVTVPVLFLFQSDDELMTRESGLALWDAIGSERRTMLINPGGHIAIPRFEQQDAALAFYRAHLTQKAPRHGGSVSHIAPTRTR